MPRTDYYSTLQEQNEQSYNSRYQQREQQPQQRTRRYGSVSQERQYDEEPQYQQPTYSRSQRSANGGGRYQPARQSRYMPAQSCQGYAQQSERKNYPSRTDERRWESNGQRGSYYGNDYSNVPEEQYEPRRQQQLQYEEPQEEPLHQEQPVEEVMEQPKERAWLKYLTGALGGGILVAIVWIAFCLHEAGMLF